jgi:hypothetical protein
MKMNSHASMYFGIRMSEQKDMRMFPPVPMVYEQVPVQAVTWEYRVLSIDTREKQLPGVAELNELGSAGWLLVSIVKASEREPVHYYFVRQQRV